MATERIAAKYVYTLEDERPMVDAYVEYDTDTSAIVSVGKASEEDDILDGAIVPGFVNAHCHVELSHLKDKFRKGTGMAGFIDQINELRDWASRERKIELTKYWMDKMWEDGVAAMADISNDDSSFQVKKSHPMYTRTFLEVFGTEPSQCREVMDSVTDLWAQANELGLDAAPTPHSCYTMSPRLLSEAAAAGLSSGFLSYHSQESQEEEQYIKSNTGAMYHNRIKAGMTVPEATGKSSLRYFIDRLRCAKPSPYDEHILLVHNVCLNQDDIDAALEVMKNVYWAICPLSNLFIHNALPPVKLMRRNNLRITVGTDSLSSNEDLDMVKELYCIQSNFPQVPLTELFSWACLNGARFLGKEDVLGSIKVGKKPSLVFVSALDADGRLTSESRSRRIV